MSEKSDTPRTDAELATHKVRMENGGYCYTEPWSGLVTGRFARELERELSAEKAVWKHDNRLWSSLLAAMKDRAERAEAALAECDAELAEERKHAEAMHGWIDRVLSCVERAEQDIGGETMDAIIPDGGPIYDAYRAFRAFRGTK